MTPDVTAIRIAFWLGTLSTAPDVADIRRRFDLSRAAGYRWRRFALDMGLPPRVSAEHPRMGVARPRRRA